MNKTLDELVNQRVYEIVKEAVERFNYENSPYPETWPSVMKQKDVKDALGVSSDTVKTLFNRSDFPAVSISDSRKIIGAAALWKWVNNNEL